MLKAFSTKQAESIPEITSLVQKNPNDHKKQKEKYNSWSPETWTIVHDHCWVFYTEKKKCLLKDIKCCAFIRESWRSAQPQRVLRCVPKASAAGCTGEPLCDLRGRGVWERLQETSLGLECLQELQLHFSFTLGHCPSFLQLCPLLPTPFIDFGSLLGLETAPFPCLGPHPQSSCTCHLWAVGWGCGERSLLWLALLPPALPMLWPDPFPL